MENKKLLKNAPPKGTADWFPREYKIRKYIFDTWRKVCTQYGYQEYLTPIIEEAVIYRAKSGEDAGGKELMTMTDRAGRELAIRPEMTPSVTRMVSRIYEGEPKPIRYFSIANYLRNEKPQRGRNREFWQLNADIFGSDSVNADIEILQLAMDLMIAFNPPKDSFKLRVNNRKLIDAILNEIARVDSEIKIEVVRILDKWEKLSEEEFVARLTELGLKKEQVENLIKFIRSQSREELTENLPQLAENEGYLETVQILESLNALGYEDYLVFQPNIIRGFDYYDGMVFEVFDNSPDNRRSLFGGGRYNGLSELFLKKGFPATGFAPGDEPTRIFFESWGMEEQILSAVKDEVIYIPLLNESLIPDVQKLAQKYRGGGKCVEVGLEVQAIGKALQYADKKGLDKVIILDENEIKNKVYKVKDMNSGEELDKSL